jgi:glycosyltransferase involved in cell wall biosynthesis
MNLESSSDLKISIIIPVYNSIPTLERCLEAATKSVYPNFECVVIDDSSQDAPQEVTKKYPVQYYRLDGGPKGPAFARNYGAEKAVGDILLFIDADVLIRSDTLTRVAEQFTKSPETAALFGSYDENPTDQGFISQYKNLTHHFVHQQADEQAVTFWSGCGAIRREVFLELGGFDVRRFTRPSIEDIELGARLTRGNYRIIVDKEIQVTHLKRWTLKGLIKTDIFDRAIPWAILILRERNLPKTLNLEISQRISAILVFILLLFLGLNITQPQVILSILLNLIFLAAVNTQDWGGNESRPVGRRPVFLVMMAIIFIAATLLMINTPLGLSLPVIAILAIIFGLNFKLYRFYIQRRGVIFALAGLSFQIFYYIYSSLAFLYATSLFLSQKLLNMPRFNRQKTADQTSENR